jgi:hypothetical protein
MAMSTDDNLIEYQPDILDYGIDEFTDYHDKARDDILRRLRTEWWVRGKNFKVETGSVRTTLTMEMDDTKLDETQFTKCAVYLVLCEYVLPQLTKWNATGDEDKFQVMMMHYRKKYDAEFNQILQDGVRYDYDADGTVEDIEKQPFHSRRMIR